MRRSAADAQFQRQGRGEGGFEPNPPGDMRGRENAIYRPVVTSPDLMIFARMGVFDAFQVPDSALERRHKVAIQETAGLGAGIIIMGGIAKGWNACDQWNGIWKQAELYRVADDRHAFVLRYNRTHPACHTNIVDTGQIDHLANNVCSAQEAGYIYQDAFRRDQIRHRNPA